VNLKGAAADSDIGTIRIEGLHPQGHIGAATAIAVIAIAVVIIVTPARPFGVWTLSHPEYLMVLAVLAARFPKMPPPVTCRRRANRAMAVFGKIPPILAQSPGIRCTPCAHISASFQEYNENPSFRRRKR
jgi:hypothetical protein